MNRIAPTSLAAGGLVYAVFSALYVLAGWPAAWFAVAAGGAVALGLYIGLFHACRTADAGGATRAWFVLIALLMTAVGVLGMVRPTPHQPPWVVWVTLGCAVYYLAAAAAPFLWSHRS